MKRMTLISLLATVFVLVVMALSGPNAVYALMIGAAVVLVLLLPYALGRASAMSSRAAEDSEQKTDFQR